MPSLLSLPTELLDAIIEHAITSCRMPPDNPESAAAQGPRLPAPDFYRLSWSASEVLYETSPPGTSITSLPLLLVNRVISLRTKEAMGRLTQAGRIDYQVDVMLVNDTQLWPTFLCVPALAVRIGTVHADFRTFTMARLDPPYQWTGFRGGGGGPPRLVWAFYSLLERFLRRGAARLAPKPGPLPECATMRRQDFLDRGVTIDTLVLNFYTTEDPGCVMGENRGPRSPCRRITKEPGARKKAISPRWLAGFLTRYIRSLLVMDYHTATHGKLLYERIGRIVVRVDGVDNCKFMLGKQLQALNHTDPSETFGDVTPRERRPEVFRAWKCEALRLRVRYGLDPSPEPEPIWDELLPESERERSFYETRRSLLPWWNDYPE
jgi:hypothetical protein